MIIGDGPAVRLGLLVITPVETAVFVALFASPQAVYSTVMSTEMGGDGHLAGQIVVWCSILGMFSLFLIVSRLLSLALREAVPSGDFPGEPDRSGSPGPVRLPRSGRPRAGSRGCRCPGSGPGRGM